VPDPDGAECPCHPCSLGRCGHCKTLAQTLASRVDAELSPRLGIDEPEHADVRELLLPGVSDLDRDDVVAAGKLEERAPPVLRPAKVRDHDH